ncbi:putative adenylate cyclase [Magnetofaba australis IT-1]|uniref:Putative adenylate cyclase n=1 Tax=Magnetofaba australis IT-1 TaxID=1434232 RepID=A0A1Y2K4Q0_9PROT|nr:putative adenylate cyclase [Magnetofaba australis IT-1]
MATHPLIGAACAKQSRIQGRTAFFDTPDLDLAARGVDLQVGRGPQGAPIQRLLNVGLAAPHVPEGRALLIWQGPAPSDAQLNLSQLAASTDTLGQIGGIDLAQLRRCFILNYERRTWKLAFPNGDKLVVREEVGALDDGDCVEPYREIELELTSGSPSRFYEVSLAIMHYLHAALTPLGPPARWQAARRPDALQPRAPRRNALRPDMHLDQAYGRINQNVLDAMVAALPLVSHGQGAVWMQGHATLLDGVRRLRLMESWFAPSIPDGIRQAMGGELAWIEERLDEARAWGALRQSLLAPFSEHFADLPGVAAMMSESDARWREARARLQEALAHPRFARFLLGLYHWMTGRGWRNRFDQEERLAFEGEVKTFAAEQFSLGHRFIRRQGVRFGFDASHPDAPEWPGRAQDDALALLGDAFIDAKPRREYQTAMARWRRLAEEQRMLLDGMAPLGRLKQTLPQELLHMLTGWLGARAAEMRHEGREAWRHAANCPPFWLGAPPLDAAEETPHE